MKLSSILGLNARFQLYSHPVNTRAAKRIASSKLFTKKALKRAKIPTPKIYAKFKEPRDVLKLDWSKLPSSFALKPSHGYGGEGVVVVKKRSKTRVGWITTQRTVVTPEDLKLHTLDILEGAYSLSNIPSSAFCEEYVGRHKAFRKYAFRGTPDIRVIVFNKVPVMAMLRLPTRESEGRANLHQGALGVGIDMATGITTNAVWHGEFIKYKPQTQRKLHGIKIPQWTEILETAVRCHDASGLGYFGADIVLHPEKGPMVLELNSSPGLQIQLANRAGLRKRLERVEDLDVRDADHGVRIAKALFAERFTDRVKAEEGIKVINGVEKVKIYSFPGGKSRLVKARIDTGAHRSSVDSELARELGLLRQDNILWKGRYAYRSASGVQTRPVVGIRFVLARKRLKTSASVSDRSKLATPFLIGRNDLTGFLVRAEEKNDN